MSIRKNIVGKMKARFFLFSISFFKMIFPSAVNAQETALVTLCVEQVFVKNSSRDVNDVFSYDLTAQGSDCPMPSGTSGGIYSFALTGTDAVNIPIIFTNSGIYQYEMSVNWSSAASGYFCDPQTYKIMVLVKMTDGILSAQMVVETNEGNKSDRNRFENSYTPLASDPKKRVDPPVKKTAAGNPSSPMTFSFTLTAGDPSFPMPEGSINGVKTITIVGSGEKDFGSWEYTREGTYCYDIAEVIISDTSYTYDESVYMITDLVKDIDGQLFVTRSVTNERNKQVGSCIFINKYKKSGGGSFGNGGSSGIDAVESNAAINDTGAAGESESIEAIGDTGSVSIWGNVPKVGDEVKIVYFYS